MSSRLQLWPAMFLLLASSSWAPKPGIAASAAHPRSVAVSMLGEIIDPQCYFGHDSQGPDHASCAAICARGGQGLAFVDAGTKKVYLLIAHGHGENPNTPLLAHIGMPVTVRGQLFDRNGNSALQIESVVQAKGAKPKR